MYSFTRRGVLGGSETTKEAIIITGISDSDPHRSGAPVRYPDLVAMRLTKKNFMLSQEFVTNFKE
jgi:hypothetical protein